MNFFQFTGAATEE